MPCTIKGCRTFKSATFYLQFLFGFDIQPILNYRKLLELWSNESAGKLLFITVHFVNDIGDINTSQKEKVGLVGANN